jgi:hypothetical protein
VDTVNLENMAVSCFSVLWAMMSKPKSENIFWIYILRPISVIILAAIASGATYLYLVPFTNIVGTGLFADYTCPASTGVWQVCGRMDTLSTKFDSNGTNVAAGFFVFLIIQATVGLYIASIILYACSRRKGYIRKFTWKNCRNSYFCWESPDNNDDWIQTDKDQLYKCGSYYCGCGPYVYYTFTICLSIATFLTTIFIGVWVGRYIAVQTVPSCTAYKNTRIGLLGCVSNANGQYVGGQDCNNCAGIGFAILALPILIVEILVIFFYLFVKRCCSIYKETKDRLERENQEQLQEVNNSDGKCNICCNFIGDLARLPCNHTMCLSCANNDAVTRCPFCRKDFEKTDIVSSNAIVL